MMGTHVGVLPSEQATMTPPALALLMLEKLKFGPVNSAASANAEARPKPMVFLIMETPYKKRRTKNSAMVCAFARCAIAHLQSFVAKCTVELYG